MRVFMTGATGFIGSTLSKELIEAGHQVLGLARSDAAAKSLAAAGIEVHRGDIEDLASLRGGASKSDAVVHLAFNHDFSKYVDNCEADRRAIEAMGSALEGSQRRLIVTSGTVAVPQGRLGTEEDPPSAGSNAVPRVASEEAGAAVAARGVNVSVVRLPQVHDRHKQGLITVFVDVAREKGVSAYVGDGANRFPAVHLLDAAHLYALVLEKGVAGARYHAVAEEGVRTRDIAEVIGRRLKMRTVSISPEKAFEHFGWLGAFAGMDCAVSSTLTQQRLGWRPAQVGMIADLEQAHNLET